MAEYISGSIDEFVNLMNTKAQEIGCKNTHFVTANGIHDDNHYTTAKDLCLIARYCMKNEIFRTIVSSPNCTIPATNKSDERYYKNTNDMVIPESRYYYDGCIGIKTGFTSQAKNCLISASDKNGLQLISVILGANLTDDYKSARYTDSKTLYDYVYSNYKFSTIVKKHDIAQTIEVENATPEKKNLDLIFEKDLSILTNINNNTSVSHEIILNNVKAPIVANEVLGVANYTIDGNIYTVNLLAANDVEKDKNLTIKLKILFLIILVFLILFALAKKFVFAT